MAVGWFDTPAEMLPLAERWTGSSWSVAPGLVGLRNAELEGVSCPATGVCTAVGVRFSGPQTLVTPRYRAVAASWDGVRWALHRTAQPSGSRHSDLAGVSCRSASDCTAVGTFERRGNFFALVERWNGSRWSIERTPPVPESGLQRVSCASRTACVAVGGWLDGTLLERWNGKRWSVQLGYQGDRAYGADLFGVSCASRRACVAVGGVQSIGGDRLVIERWNGGAWLRPRLSQRNAILYGVSCPSARVCVAVGVGSLVEASNGGRWRTQKVGFRASFADVSCARRAGCVAVGTTGVDTAVMLAARRS